jgi:alpha-methylacyl-CoA racemase
MSAGPLAGLRVVEVAAIGPSTFAAMVLADLGADVIRIDRADAAGSTTREPDFLVGRGRPSVAVDLKHTEGVAVVHRLAGRADVLIEGFRPGVAERLGIGPDDCRAHNGRLVYARCTGWGQEGPYAQTPGHDVNYIATTGVLNAIRREGSRPAIPLNLVGDYGGGGMLTVVGILAAVWEAARSGAGQVIDAAMVDGAALLTTLIYGMRSLGRWHDEVGVNGTDGGLPFYDVYETADGKFVALGAGEPPFFARLLDILGLTAEFPDQYDRSRWPAMRAAFADRVRTRTRDEWAALLPDPLLCLTPVLTWSEAPRDPHNAARQVYVDVDGVKQPAPAPRFSRTPVPSPTAPAWPGEHTCEALAAWGFEQDEVQRLCAVGAIVQRP